MLIPAADNVRIMRISVSGKQFVFPRSCACCGAHALTTLAVSGTERNRRARTRGWTWDIPYCVVCKQHIRSSERILLAALTLSALGLFSGFVAAAWTGRWELGLELAVFMLLATCFTCGALWRYVRGKSSINCLGMARAVAYLGSDGSCHTFDIKSAFYAADFVRANHRKLVNVSPRVASILRNTSYGEFQVPRRLVKNGR